MPQVLRNKNLATRFQIMVEIAARQPSIQQKDIARHIGVTSQAVSEYINTMEKDGWLISDGRSHYRLTKEGVNWLLKALRELQQYANESERILTRIMTWAAIADTDIKKGQTVGLIMRDGLLTATGFAGNGAHGIATADAHKGEDVGIADIEDIVALDIGRVTVIEVPDIQSGGSSRINRDKIQNEVNRSELLGVLGVEALVSLRRLNLKPDYIYGTTHAAIEAAHSGMSFAIVCTTNESPLLLQKLAEENINYKLVNARKK